MNDFEGEEIIEKIKAIEAQLSELVSCGCSCKCCENKETE